MEHSKVTFSVTVASQLHNHPSPTLMDFCTQTPNARALPCQEATCLGSRRPVRTRPRLLYLPVRLPARPPEPRHVSPSNSWVLQL